MENAQLAYSRRSMEAATWPRDEPRPLSKPKVVVQPSRKMKWRKALICFGKEKKMDPQLQADGYGLHKCPPSTLAYETWTCRHPYPHTREVYDLQEANPLFRAKNNRGLARPVRMKKSPSSSYGSTQEVTMDSRKSDDQMPSRRRTSSGAMVTKYHPTHFQVLTRDNQEGSMQSRRSLPAYLQEDQNASTQESRKSLPLYLHQNLGTQALHPELSPNGIYPEIYIPVQPEPEPIEELSTSGVYSESGGISQPTAPMMNAKKFRAYQPDGVLEATLLRVDSNTSNDYSLMGEAFHVSVYNFSERMSYDLAQAGRNLTTVAGQVARVCSAQAPVIKKS